jgi:transposase
MSTLIIGVDLATAHFELAVSDAQFRIQRRQGLSRVRFARFCSQLPPSLILMEACSSAHYWARTLQAWGHQVRLLPVQYVQAYVRRNKTDAADAAALLDAVRCCEIRPVPVKSVDQQLLQQLHRLREQYKITRNARMNLLRAALRELGMPIPAGLQRSLQAIRTAVHTVPSGLPAVLTVVCARVLQEIEQLQQGMTDLETTLRDLTREDPVVRDLMTIPGVGLLIATALRATVGDIERFPSGRHLACWLGLTAREYSSGERRRLGRISRQGDVYVRSLLVNGARSALLAANRAWTQGGVPLDRLRTWALQTQQRCGLNKATVALANKLARIVWATWRSQRPFNGNWHDHAAASG